MDEPVLYPWLRDDWRVLQQAIAMEHLPHAMLLSGVAGLGKLALAYYLAHYVLCRSTTDRPCGTCKTCRLLRADTLPDFHQIRPDSAGGAIRIDQIRTLCQALNLTAQIADTKIAVLSPADRMNRAAANSLLKTLEEPTDKTLIVLVTDYPHRLPLTIRSRCRRITLHAPERNQALAWLRERQVAHAATLLALNAGAPLAAEQYAGRDWLQQRLSVFNDFVQLLQNKAHMLAVSEQWRKQYFPDCLHWLMSWVVDMIRLKMAAPPPALANPDFAERLQVMTNTLDLKQLFHRLAHIQQAIRQQTGNLNTQMLMDAVLEPWCAKNDRRQTR